MKVCFKIVFEKLIVQTKWVFLDANYRELANDIIEQEGKNKFPSSFWTFLDRIQIKEG